MGRFVKGYPPESNRGDEEGRPGLEALSAFARSEDGSLFGKGASGGRLGMGVTCAV